MITQRPNFVDSPYFVDDDQGWRLLPGAPKEITREFNRFMKLTSTPFVPYERPSDRDVATDIDELSDYPKLSVTHN